MHITYPSRSKFLEPIERSIVEERHALMAGQIVTIQLEPGGYNRLLHDIIVCQWCKCTQIFEYAWFWWCRERQQPLMFAGVCKGTYPTLNDAFPPWLGRGCG